MYRFALIFTFLLCTGVSAQQAASPTIHGVVTTQNGSIRLPGALVTVRDQSGTEIAHQLTEGDGRFGFDVIPEGKYHVFAALEGFTTIDVAVVVKPGRTSEALMDLPIAAVSERVEVVAPTKVVSSGDTISTADTMTGREADQLAPGGGLQAALRLLASVIEVPGGVSIKGGRPNQSSIQLGSSTLADPTTGMVHVNLPDDAVDSIAVLPNPYAVEYGRFSSGLVVIQTRRAGDQWKVRLNNLDPTFRTKRHKELFSIKGIASFGPRLEVGGPLVKDRVFLQQSAQYRYGAHDVPSRPEDELTTSQWFSSFSRIDANLSSRHSIVATAGLFPSVARMASLGTFTPPDATVDVHDRVNQAKVTERALWTDTLFSESTVQVYQYRTSVAGQGAAPMELYPDTTAGNFFNRQSRNTTTYQWVETVSGSRKGALGLHLFKGGIDLLHSRYEGTSASAPVLIRRPDGRLVRRLDFAGPTAQSVHSTDFAVFAQDRLQPTTRWFLEYGVRVDRDGIVERFNATPRVGTAVLLTTSGSSLLRGGYGLFYERTPSAAGAFTQFENFFETRFASDGVTPLGAPVMFSHVSRDLRTPRSATWDVAYDYRFNPKWTLHAGVLNRRGSNELVIVPAQRRDSAEWLLQSNGRSVYREAEVGLHFTRAPVVDLDVSYARSAARGDLNAFTGFFDNTMWPIVGRNAYARLNSDVPNRLFARGRLMPNSRWLFLGILDWRTGFPYSIVDEALDFVGPRNETYRFPNHLRLDLGLEHRFKIFKYQPWIGIRAYNALNAFLPTDVQANLSSPAFGSLYNSDYRQLRLQVRFER